MRSRISLEWLTTDLRVVILYVVLAQVIWVLPDGSVVRFLLALPLLLFVPGYVLTTLVADSASGHSRRRNRRELSLDAVERAALGFGLSVVLLVLSSVPLWALAVPVGMANVVLLSVFTGVGALLSGLQNWRRGTTAVEPVRNRSLADHVRRLFTGDSKLDVALNVVLVASVGFAVATLSLGVAAPLDGESYTEAVLMTENETGELVTAGFPSELTSGEPQPYHLLVENNEGQPMDYSVVVQLQRVDGGEVTEVEEQHRETLSVSAGEQRLTEHDVTPSITGDSLRLTYLIYRGEAPQTPDKQSAYRSLHVWVDVEPPDST